MARFEVYHNELRLNRKGQILNAHLCLVHCSEGSSALEVDSVLHTSELAYYYTTLKHEQRKKSFLLGRLAAKMQLDIKRILICQIYKFPRGFLCNRLLRRMK
ncbi:hypothetical protein ACFFIS_06515 [Virgibacillus soli]|uniref:Uncharacterized protein n=1 Tax=Paracerasibacillus soli TaxID=480284 RepID=A0ABU5CU37_9BACI|nr:hypothetical protein [Virgibacillus soli]MDY0409869.1 hypothetical protein [Virgibacillus soli]